MLTDFLCQEDIFLLVYFFSFFTISKTLRVKCHILTFLLSTCKDFHGLTKSFKFALLFVLFTTLNDALLFYLWIKKIKTNWIIRKHCLFFINFSIFLLQMLWHFGIWLFLVFMVTLNMIKQLLFILLSFFHVFSTKHYIKINVIENALISEIILIKSKSSYIFY